MAQLTTSLLMCGAPAPQLAPRPLPQGHTGWAASTAASALRPSVARRLDDGVAPEAVWAPLLCLAVVCAAAALISVYRRKARKAREQAEELDFARGVTPPASLRDSQMGTLERLRVSSLSALDLPPNDGPRSGSPASTNESVYSETAPPRPSTGFGASEERQLGELPDAHYDIPTASSSPTRASVSAGELSFPPGPPDRKSVV